jgi:hypothetical protein
LRGPRKFLSENSAKICLLEISAKKIGRADFYRDFRPFSSFSKKMEFSPMYYATGFSRISEISRLIPCFGK